MRAVLLDLVEQVGAQEHGGAPLPRDRADVAQHLPLPRRVEAERRLVQEHGDRVVDERARDAEPLPHPAAVGRDRRSRCARAARARRAASGRRSRAPARASARRGGRGRSGTARPSGRRDSPRSPGSTPIRRRISSGRVCGMPATEKLPRLGSRIVVSMRTAVVLPAPFGPEDAEDLPGLHGDRQVVDGEQLPEVASRSRCASTTGVMPPRILPAGWTQTTLSAEDERRDENAGSAAPKPVRIAACACLSSRTSCRWRA